MGRDRQGRSKNKRSKKELGGERREVYKESERARRGLDLREPFLEAPPARVLIREPDESKGVHSYQFTLGNSTPSLSELSGTMRLILRSLQGLQSTLICRLKGIADLQVYR
ncbi:hypothetical protein TNCV_3043341 [Trichonephila clavipes]|nr:hypothetical protein TNCV_3043341 [Trichonephila clavipes]